MNMKSRVLILAMMFARKGQQEIVPLSTQGKSYHGGSQFNVHLRQCDVTNYNKCAHNC